MDPYDENTNDLVDPRPSEPLKISRLEMRDEDILNTGKMLDDLRESILHRSLELNFAGISTELGPNPFYDDKFIMNDREIPMKRLEYDGIIGGRTERNPHHDFSEDPVIFDRTPLFELIEYDPGDEEKTPEPDPANAPDWTITDLGDTDILKNMEDEIDEPDDPQETSFQGSGIYEE